MHASSLDMDWLNSRADRIEQALAQMSLPARIDGGDIGTDRVCFHLLPLDSKQSNLVAQAAREIAKAVGVAEVHVLLQPDGLIIDVPLNHDRALRLLPLMGALADLESLTAVVGMSDQGRPLLLDLKQQDSWHLWIEGPRASGKSELLRTLVISLALQNRASHLKLLGIDVSGHELGIIEALPHTLTRLATNKRHAYEMIGWLELEIERRLRKGIQQPAILLAIDDLAWMDMRPSSGLAGSFRRVLSYAVQAGVHVLAASRSVRTPTIRRMLSASEPMKAVSMARSEQEAGLFEFQSARGNHRRARVAWLSAADLQIAVARAEARAPLGAHSLPRLTRERVQ
jgi:hypothetical protein